MFLLAGGLGLAGRLAAGDWENPPLYVVSEKIELIVGRELTVVSGHLVFRYEPKDDTEHLPQLYLHLPLYVKRGTGEWSAGVDAANFELQIAGLAFKPASGSIVGADSLSNYPVPEDAEVAFLTFAVPRALAEPGFEVTINYVQSTFSYLGARLALFTPWQPRSMRQHPYLALADNVFELRVTAARGVFFRRIPNDTPILSESPTVIVAVPDHRKTIAVAWKE